MSCKQVNRSGILALLAQRSSNMAPGTGTSPPATAGHKASPSARFQ